MTSHLGARLRGAWVCLAALAAAGCGSDSHIRSFEITAPEKGAELGFEDDVDEDMAGLQYDVEATASRVNAGTTVLLLIETPDAADDEPLEAAESTVAKDGSIVFAGVTLPAGTHTLQVKTATGSVQSAPDHDYTFKALVIDSPTDAAAIGAGEDEDAAKDGIQIDVAVSAYGIDSDEDITLQVDGAVVGAAVQADDEGMALFTGVTLAPGSHSLKAVAGKTESSAIRVSVRQPGCAAVQFTSPEPPADGDSLVLGGATCPASGADYVLDVVVSTDAADGEELELLVNGARAQTAEVKDEAARFSDVVLDRRDTPNQLAVIAQGPEGACEEVAFPVGIELDCVEGVSDGKVQIESPADGTTYNALGNGGHTQTADTTSPVCTADVVVLCSELGTDVELRHALTDATAIAASPCEAPESGDPALPDGFAGRARLSAVAFSSGSDETGMLVATQPVMGTGSSAVAASSVITLHGDCRPPSVALAPNFCGASQTIGVPLATDHVTRDLVVSDDTMDTAEVTIHVTNAGGAIDSTVTQSTSAGSTTFTGVDLGTPNAGVSTAMIGVTVTDDFANSISTSCSVDIAFDLPVLTLTSPTDAQSFGIGGGCNSGMTGVYGVPLAMTADKTADRSATVTVGALTSAYGPPLASAAITGCIPAAEGAHTLQVELESSLSGAKVTRSVSFTVDTLSVSAPTPNQAIGPACTCSTGMVSETGIPVTAALDPIHNGRSVSFQAGSNRLLTTTVVNGAATGCVPASLGNNTLTAILLNGANPSIAMQAVEFSLVTVTPTGGIPITTVTLPPDATYRTGDITLAWTLPVEAFPGQLKTYALRCANTALDVDTGTQTDWDAWWTNAKVFAMPSGVVPPTSSAAVGFRIGEVAHCVLRAADALGQNTPLVDSKPVDYAFRRHLVTPTSTGQRVGIAAAAIGDVDGDDLDDLLIGGVGEAHLVFGSSTPWATSNSDVVLQGELGSPLGQVITELGDFNGDGMDDFAISESSWTNPNGGLVSAGRVHLFYGRAARDWPATIDLRGACAADVCFENAQEEDSFGWALAGAGDFNDDGTNDLAIGAIHYPSLAAHGRVYVILGKAYEQGMTKTPGNKFWNISVSTPGGAPLQGFVLSSDGVQAELLGYAIVGVSNFDGRAGEDLVISALGFSALTDRLFFLSGRPYDLSTETGFKPLTMADFGFFDLDVPSGLPLDVSTTKGTTGSILAVLGNAYDVPGGQTPGAIDIAVLEIGTDHFVLYPGDNAFAPADKVRVTGASASSEIGGSIANGFSAALGTDLGDLDGDGKPELCASDRISSLTGSTPGQAFLWYSDVVQTATASDPLSYLDASPIAPPAGVGTARRLVEYAGDLNGDGDPDLVVGAPLANSRGELTILY